MIQNQFLSPHFELREFTESATARKHGIVNEPPAEAVENLKALCEHTLEPLRKALGLPIIINSGYRCKALNHLLVQHSEKSQHMNGQAADFWVKGPADCDATLSKREIKEIAEKTGASRRELLIRAFRQIILDERIVFDQLIIYPTFIHVSYVSNGKNRGRLTKGYGNGKYCALTRAEALALV